MYSLCPGGSSHGSLSVPVCPPFHWISVSAECPVAVLGLLVGIWPCIFLQGQGISPHPVSARMEWLNSSPRYHSTRHLCFPLEKILCIREAEGLRCSHVVSPFLLSYNIPVYPQLSVLLLLEVYWVIAEKWTRRCSPTKLCWLWWSYSTRQYGISSHYCHYWDSWKNRQTKCCIKVKAGLQSRRIQK